MTKRDDQRKQKVYFLVSSTLERGERERLDGDVYRKVCSAAFNNGFDIKVSWDGTTEQFLVLTTEGTWETMDNLSLGARNSILQAPAETRMTACHARFRREGPGADKPFCVRIARVNWTAPTDVVNSWCSNPAFTAIRSEHYHYDPSDDSGYQAATLSDNVQALQLELQVGADYEIWVSLNHPIDPNAEPHIIDPLVRTGNSGG